LIQLLNVRNLTRSNVLLKVDQFLYLHSHGEQGLKKHILNGYITNY